MSVNNGMELGRELAKTLVQINMQLGVVHAAAEKQGESPHELKNGHGDYILSPLLAAKAQTLHSLVLVNQRV